MTKEQHKRLDELTEKYKLCFIVRGPFHAKHNERRIEKFIAERRPQNWEFIRINVETTYVFWNPNEEDKTGGKVYS